MVGERLGEAEPSASLADAGALALALGEPPRPPLADALPLAVGRAVAVATPADAVATTLRVAVSRAVADAAPLALGERDGAGELVAQGDADGAGVPVLLPLGDGDARGERLAERDASGEPVAAGEVDGEPLAAAERDEDGEVVGDADATLALALGDALPDHGALCVKATLK